MHHLVLFIMGFLAYFLGGALMVLCGQIERALRAIQGGIKSPGVWLDEDDVDMLFIGLWPIFMPIVLLACALEWTENRIEGWAMVKITRQRTREEDLVVRLKEAKEEVARLEQRLKDKAQDDYLNAWGK